MTAKGRPQCPNCAWKMQVVSTISGGIPSVGDVSLCVRCRAHLRVTEVVGESPTFSILTDEEFISLPDQDRIGLKRMAALFDKIEKSGGMPDFDRMTHIREVFDKEGDALGELVRELVESTFDKKVGYILIVRDMTNNGFQGVLSDVGGEMEKLDMLRRATVELAPKDVIKKVRQMLGG